MKAWLARFLCMFNSSTDEWVVGLDVEYTIVLGREKDLKDEERKKPAVGGSAVAHAGSTIVSSGLVAY